MEDAYNDWYSNQHVHDVADIPGVVSAQRFRLTDHGDTGGESKWQYMALYNLKTDNVSQVLEDLGARAGTDRMPMHEALDIDVWTKIYEEIPPSNG